MAGEPMCRTCWLASLSESERSRAAAERITGCVYLCPEHEAAMDALLVSMPTVAYIKASVLRSQRDFFLAVDMPAAADHCEQAAIGHDADVAFPPATTPGADDDD